MLGGPRSAGSGQALHQILDAKLELLEAHYHERGRPTAALFASQLVVDPLVDKHQSVQSVGHRHSSSKALLSIGVPVLV